MKRREFIAGLGAATWPLPAIGQQTERTRRIGVLLLVSRGDTEFQRRIAALREGLADLGWDLLSSGGTAAALRDAAHISA